MQFNNSVNIWTIPEIGTNYGVIVNKVSKPVLEKLEGKKNDFINTMFAGIPENQRCVYTSVSFFEKSTYLEDRENLWLNPEEFKDDQGKPLLQFVYETGMVTNTTPLWYKFCLPLEGQEVLILLLLLLLLLLTFSFFKASDYASLNIGIPHTFWCSWTLLRNFYNFLIVLEFSWVLSQNFKKIQKFPKIFKNFQNF